MLLLVLLSILSCTVSIPIEKNPSINEALNWAEVTASRIVNCHYDKITGLWIDELRWQSGNTLETLANFISLVDSPLKFVFHQTYIKTDMYVGGDCFDDYQWWLLGWMQAYAVQSDANYLLRAANIHDVVSGRAWNTSQCGGGIQWCPKNGYKNAITNELFLASSMRLHPYASLLGKSSTYYLDWALKEWQWFEQSGMINSNYLINDGLNTVTQSDGTCVNNNQTTWTYNQGVILSGLGLLYNATKNSTLITIAQKIADATIERLTYPNGILKETCEPTCDNDQKLFKGIFVRHLAYLLPFLTDPEHIQNYTKFLQQNSLSVWNSERCELDGLYSLIWNNQSSVGCESTRNIATTSSAWDLFLSLARSQSSSIPSSSNWTLLGLGNCMDDQNASMTNFYKLNVNETVCRTTAEQDEGSVAFDFELDCLKIGSCRIRTLSDRQKTPPGWIYEPGNAHNVTRTNKMPVTSCYLKKTQVDR